MSEDYESRTYLSAVEAAKFLSIPVGRLHELVKQKRLSATKAASGQYRFDLREIQRLETTGLTAKGREQHSTDAVTRLCVNDTVQTVYVKNSQCMDDLEDDSVHLMLTSPPYFDAKMYAKERVEHDLGDVHDLSKWFLEISQVWKEVLRVLQPGRKAFINIMNLPIREKHGFRTLNLVGRTVDACEELGFVFKRDVVWHKTNSVRAHFGTYPYPGGILLNHAHEFILEFEKPAPKGCKKYAHVSREQKEASKLDRDFWVSLKKSDVWLMKPQGSGDRRSHVAPFPYELPYRLIRAYSFVGETVLDPFLGSGTALVVARDLGRHGVGYEVNPDIATEAIDRIKAEQQAKLF